MIAALTRAIAKRGPASHRMTLDNGSEFINHTVEKRLNKLLIEQAKSLPRHSHHRSYASHRFTLCVVLNYLFDVGARKVG